jgi:hypothetical protein
LRKVSQSFGKILKKGVVKDFTTGLTMFQARVLAEFDGLACSVISMMWFRD